MLLRCVCWLLIAAVSDGAVVAADEVDDALAAIARGGPQAAGSAAGDRRRAIDEYRRAFEHSRAAEQATQSAAMLKALGETADIAAHLGFVVDRYLLGPFEALCNRQPTSVSALQLRPTAFLLRVGLVAGKSMSGTP